MSRVETLRASRNKFSVKLMDFMRAVSSNRNRLVCFFEGGDKKYYSIRINNMRPGLAWTSINCLGKKNVLDLREWIRGSRKYSDSAVAFFVDRDFDSDLCCDDDLYITPCYSIENLYVNCSVFKDIISIEFNMDEFCTENSDFRIATEIFENRFIEYCHAIHAFNVWIMAHQLMKNSGKAEGSLNINNVNFDNLISVSLDEITAKYEADSVEDLFPEAGSVTEYFISEAESYFDREDKQDFYRGKQQIEFLRVLLDKIKKEKAKNDSILFSNNRTPELQLSKRNIISELSQYASTPACLASFLQNLLVAA